jgi:hypothetical protein
MSKVAFVVVKCGGEELHIQSEFAAEITLPNAALGRLIDFEQLKTNCNLYVMLVKYWVGSYMIFSKKILGMFKAFNKQVNLQLKTELQKLPYVQLFIMSIIKSDDVMFMRLYPYIDTSDLEMCHFITENQFSEQYNDGLHDEQSKVSQCKVTQCKVTQSILKLFRHIRANKIQNVMLSAIFKKMTLQHIVYQIYMLECEKYNITMYNIAALHVDKLVRLSGCIVDHTSWATWPYIHMPNIEHEEPSALYATGPNWPHAGLDGQKYTKADQHKKIIKFQNPIWKISYGPLAQYQMHEMRTCPKLNPSLKSVQRLDDTHELPRAKKDYSEFLGLAPARAIEFSWPSQLGTYNVQHTHTNSL